MENTTEEDAKVMSNQDESNKNSTHNTTLSEMEETLTKRIDDEASDHDRTTRAHIDGIDNAMNLMGEKMDVKVDGIEQSMQKQYEGFEKSMQNQFAELKSSITELREIVEKQIAATNKLRDDLTKQRLWLFGTLVTLAGIVIAAVALLT